MSPDPPSLSAVITDRQQLVEYFRRGAKAPEDRGIGTEHEKFVFRRKDARMLSFEEPGGFGDLLEELMAQFDWQPAPLDGGRLVSVVRDGQSITLEPGGQFELSGAVCRTVFETAREFDTHLEELRKLAGHRLLFAIWGINPGVTLDDVPWMPKGRYHIMRRYLPTRGKLAHWMMKTTCTVQANFDYCSEADAVDLIHTAVLISPVVGALFANSPIQAGKPTGFQSRRNFIWWHHTDPDRTGVPSFMYRRDWGFEDYVEYALDVPMFFIERQGELVDMAGHSFRRFIDEGHKGHQATMGDFELHLSTLFPDVRLKQFVEVRSADGGPRDSVLALPALWKGILYDDQARSQATALFHPFTEASHRELVTICYEDGIHGQSSFGPVIDLAKELVDISLRGLDRIAADGDHRSEAEFLTPLEEILDNQTSLADRLLEDFQELGEAPGKLAERWQL